MAVWGRVAVQPALRGRAAVPPPSRMLARERTGTHNPRLRGSSCCRDAVAAAVVAPRRRGHRRGGRACRNGLARVKRAHVRVHPRAHGKGSQTSTSRWPTACRAYRVPYVPRAYARSGRSVVERELLGPGPAGRRRQEGTRRPESTRLHHGDGRPFRRHRLPFRRHRLRRRRRYRRSGRSFVPTIPGGCRSFVPTIREPGHPAPLRCHGLGLRHGDRLAELLGFPGGLTAGGRAELGRASGRGGLEAFAAVLADPHAAHGTGRYPRPRNGSR